MAIHIRHIKSSQNKHSIIAGSIKLILETWILWSLCFVDHIFEFKVQPFLLCWQLSGRKFNNEGTNRTHGWQMQGAKLYIVFSQECFHLLATFVTIVHELDENFELVVHICICICVCNYICICIYSILVLVYYLVGTFITILHELTENFELVVHLHLYLC